MTKIDANTGECPECGVSWLGAEIPVASRESYGNSTHFSRLVGIEVPERYDGVSYWECPDCKTRWDRFTKRKVVNAHASKGHSVE